MTLPAQINFSFCLTGRGPKTVKLFTNLTKTMDFDTAESSEALYTLEYVHASVKILLQSDTESSQAYHHKLVWWTVLLNGGVRCQVSPALKNFSFEGGGVGENCKVCST